jgi:pyruvate formate lyase activating enzyme
MRQAALYTRLSGDRVRCRLCAHRCTIAAGKRGLCHVRENRGGTLYSLIYGKLISQAIDPIEKKPLFHFYPGSTSLSVATVGCNLACTFCQNAGISQLVRDGDGSIDGQEVAPERIVRAAQRYQCRSISYTYTEPTIFYEYSYDIAMLAHATGLANVYVTNGYMTAEMLDTMTWDDRPPLLDAANVDLKAFTDAFYKRECGASLQPVLDSLKLMKRRGVWLEVTTLLIPELNDSDAELRALTHWLVTELGPDTPWHVSRFHPTYHLTDRPPTPVATLHRAREIGLEAGLRYVYEGNVPGRGGEDTLCSQCSQVVIKRAGFDVYANKLQGGKCAYCGAEIAGVW